MYNSGGERGQSKYSGFFKCIRDDFIVSIAAEPVFDEMGKD
jgi:hypothetical protein